MKRLDIDETESRIGNNEAREKEMLEFLNDVEEDEVIRGTVNKYKDPNKDVDPAVETDDDDGDLADDLPELTVMEMLDDLNLDDGPDDDKME